MANVHDLVDLVVGRLDVERTEHETLSDGRRVAQYSDRRRRTHTGIVGFDRGNTRRTATDHHGNTHAVCRSAREFPGSCDFSSSETYRAQPRVFAGSAAAT